MSICSQSTDAWVWQVMTMGVFLKSCFTQDEYEAPSGLSSFYGVNGQADVAIDSEIVVDAPINDLYGRHFTFRGPSVALSDSVIGEK